jgi:uracil-DNA glycosylase
MELARGYLRYQVNMGFTEMLLPKPGPKAVAVACPPVTEPEHGSLEAVREHLGECTRCPLHQKRNTIVFGEGNPKARLMFVGEGPGADEDRQGRPFVGKAGQLLTKMIQAMQMDRSEVYIANVVKCRPPNNREPNQREIATCLPFLEAQIDAVKPHMIVALGKVSATSLLDTHEPISRLRGQFHFRNSLPVMPTYHPSYLLRAEPDKRPKAETWSDLKQVMARLDSQLSDSGDERW